jgi:hypothetical protein
MKGIFMIQDEKNYEPLLWKPREAAKSLAISPSLLWRLTKQGKIPSIRINRNLRYDPANLRKWIGLQQLQEDLQLEEDKVPAGIGSLQQEQEDLQQVQVKGDN